jgi:enoyl-[acyl-carrier-protein] reductase (NADH)
VIAFHQGALLAAELMKRRGSLTVYLGIELGRHNIQVNTVSAGPIYGELLSSYPDAERLIPYWESLSPDGKLGDASHIADAVIYLLSSRAAKINGGVILVDGAASHRM